MLSCMHTPQATTAQGGDNTAACQGNRDLPWNGYIKDASVTVGMSQSFPLPSPLIPTPAPPFLPETAELKDMILFELHDSSFARECHLLSTTLIGTFKRCIVMSTGKRRQEHSQDPAPGMVYEEHGRTPSTHGLFDIHFSSNMYFEVINPHTVGSLTIPRACIKWV